MIPEGYHSVTPSLTAVNGRDALDFYVRAFGAVEIFRMEDSETGKLVHAEFQIGDSRIMISDEFPEFGAVAPPLGMGGLFMIYVEDVDAAFARAVFEGGTVLQVPVDQFWGDRSARIADPIGYRWTLATRLREVGSEEMAKAVAEWSAHGDA